MVRLHAVAASLLIAAVAAAGDASCVAAAEAQATLSRLRDIGYTVTEHKFQASNSTSFGANPGNPYVIYDMPAPTFALGAKDAVLFVGCTPGKTRYFSWRSYLFLNPKVSFSSLGDSVNNLVINTTGSDVYDRTAAIITTADSRTFEDVSAALGDAGLGDAVNLDGYDASLLKQPRLSTFLMLHRASVWEDPVAAEAYFAQSRPVYYLTAPSRRPPSPLPRLPLRQKGTGKAERDIPDLADGVTQLEKAVALWAAARGSSELLRLPMADYQPDGFPLDGFKCIQAGTNCEGDNRDANYIVTGFDISDPVKLQIKQGQVLLFFGTNSVATGKCTYTNLGLYLWGKSPLPQATTLTVDDRHFVGSAEYFAPDLDAGLASKLFAVAVSRDCTGIQFCLEVPESEVPLDGQMAAVYRSYLEPVTKTGPLVSELVLPIGVLFGQASIV